MFGAYGLPKFEASVYVLLAMGTLGDHFSTMVALTRPYIYETNPFTVELMTRGLWHVTDLLMIIAGITVPFLLMRLIRHPSLRGVLAYPLVLGAVRLCACLWNLSLIM